MAMQAYLLVNQPKSNIEEGFADPGFTTGSGSRVGVYLMTGTLGDFSYKNYHDSAIRQAMNYAREQINAGNYDQTNAKVFACKIGTEECRTLASSNDIAWEEAAVEVPALIAGRTVLLTEAVKVGRDYMRERLPDPTATA